MRARITGLVIAFAALAFAAPAAHAASETPNCAGLQAALNQAVAGDTITLDQLCTDTNSGAADGAFTLPTEAAFTLTGQTGSGAGFDGAGVSGSVLIGTSVGGASAGANFTLSSLTVENGDSDAAAVSLETLDAGGINVQSMTFTNNTITDGSEVIGGGLDISDYGGCETSGTTYSPLTLSDSDFTGNSVAGTGDAIGGGAVIFDGCGTPLRSLSVTGNVFTSNHASSSETTTSFWGVLGGGLAVMGEGATSEPLTQSDNTFYDNSVTGTGSTPTSDYGGGGEWLEGMNLTSTDDSFVANTAIGATGSGGSWTWGAGLGIVNSSCSSSPAVEGTATQLVASGNTVTGGTAADIDGAGIYTGCNESAGSDLTLQDSTVSGNSSVAGSVAGIGGLPTDHLALTNTIDTGNI